MYKKLINPGLPFPQQMNGRDGKTLLHPIVPDGCEMVREYLGLGEELWDWDNIFKPLDEFFLLHDASNDNNSMEEKENPSGINKKVSEYQLKFLEPRVDFFRKHESQLDV